MILVPLGQHPPLELEVELLELEVVLPLELVVELPELDPLELGQQQVRGAQRGQIGDLLVSVGRHMFFNVQPISQQSPLELDEEDELPDGGQQQFTGAPRKQYGCFNISPDEHVIFNVQPISQQSPLELDEEVEPLELVEVEPLDEGTH